MLWYGQIKNSNFKNLYKRHSHRYNVFTKTLSFTIQQPNSLSYTNLMFYIPSQWDFILLNTKSNKLSTKIIYLFSQTYYFKFLIKSPLLTWFYDKQTNTLALTNVFVSNFYRLYFRTLSALFHSFSRLVFLKLKFKGKGYYIYKNNRNTVTTQFGHSHRLYIYSYCTTVKFLTKTSVFLFGSSKRDILTVGHSIKNAKFINIFTGRGVRFARQIVYKKTGKVSSYK